MIAWEIDVCTVMTLSLNSGPCRCVERMEGAKEEGGREEEEGKRRGRGWSGGNSSGIKSVC